MDIAPAGGPRVRRPSSPLLALSTVAVGALMALPVVYLLIRGSGATSATWDLILRDRTLWLALRSLGLAAAVTVAAIAVGLPLAWLTVRTDLPGRRAWAVLAALPLVVPSYVGALALLAAFGPRGMVQAVLEGPLGIDQLPGISGFPGAFLTLTLFTYPYVYLVAAAGIRSIDPSLEEAARTLGETRWAVFRRVTLPLLRPSIAAGGLLVALYTLHDFGAVSLMRYQTFTQAIYLQYRAAFDRTPAAILSLMLVGLALLVLIAERRARGRARYFRVGTGTSRPPRPISLGRWRWVALAFCGLVVAMALVLPAAVLVYWMARGVSGGEGLDLAGPALGSIAASGAGALLALLAAMPVALYTARRRGLLPQISEHLTYSGYALPGIVVALAFVFFTANYLPFLYQSLPLVVIAYVVLFLPQAAEPLRDGIRRINPRVEEAGRVLGESRSGVLRRVILPLVARPALAGFGLVFLTAMKELPATLLLRPTGFDTLATRVWTASSVSRFGQAAAPALLLVLLSAVPLYVMARRVETQEVKAL